LSVVQVRLAGAQLPKLALDGRDLAPVLFNASHDVSPHDCVYHWRGAPGQGCPVGHDDCPGLWAVRCGKFKAHWVTMDSVGAERGKPRFYLDAPLLFDLEVDPSEMHAIPKSSALYKSNMPKILDAAGAHKASVLPVPNQMRLGIDPQLKVCCDWHSTKRYPKLPTCTCDAANFHSVFVCAPVTTPWAGGPNLEMEVAASDGSVRLARGVDPTDSSTWAVEPPLVYQDA